MRTTSLLTSTSLLLYLLLLACVSLPQPCNGAQEDYEYYYYYEDELPPVEEDKPAAEEKIPDYDLSELVAAWKEYIRDKAEKELAEEDNFDRRRPSGQRRRPGAGRPRRPSRPDPVVYEEYECEPRAESYRVSDPAMCDKYYECNIKGEESEHLCPDGLMYEEKSQNCDYPSKVNCGARTELQPAQPSKNCPRANGFFAWPAEESCQKFWDCRGGTSYLQICPQGVIFDMTIDSCVTPDQSKREECLAEKFLKYDCPNYSSEEPLRFGNHDRLPDPDDCQKFYSCLRDGQPRLGVCPRKTVFNNATGLCDDPNTVPGCENFWKDKEKEELQDYYDYDYS